MLHKTRGIVINYIRFRETSIIVKVYTEAFGLQTYIENGVRSSRSRNKIALFQPLTLLDLVVYHKDNGAIARISEIRCHTPLVSLPYDFRKSGMAIFMTEVLSKTLKEETANPDLFAFLFNAIQLLDTMPSDFENFHLQFLLKLARYLGFAPASADELLDHIGEGRAHYQETEEKIALNALITNRFDQHIRIPGYVRRSVLDSVIKFYAYQIEGFGEIRSMAVLKEVMS